jgi:NifU-like protein involved in Fe-S cluster formation
MTEAAKLYTPEVLALATSLANFPWDETLPLQGSARSKSCGSTITLGLACDPAGNINRIGIRAQACAIGQASAAVFAAAARGQGGEQIAAAHAALKKWLNGEGPVPDWPGMDALAQARSYPGRHGAIGLAWVAACDLLPTAETPR